MEIQLQGKIAWVTGGTGAIGRAVCLALARAGAAVAVSSRTPEAVQSLAQELNEGGQTRALGVPADLTRAGSVAEALQTIQGGLGAVDILVNSTTVSGFGEFLDLTDEHWEQVIQTKLLGYMRSMRAVLPGMIAAGGGNIVNISGRGGIMPSSIHLPGGSANAGVNLISKGLANAFGPNIRVNTVCPGAVRSPRWEEIAKTAAKVDGKPPTEATRGANTPMGRISEPEDVADAVIYLLSDLAKFITGALIYVDGGALPTVQG